MIKPPAWKRASIRVLLVITVPWGVGAAVLAAANNNRTVRETFWLKNRNTESCPPCHHAVFPLMTSHLHRTKNPGDIGFSSVRLSKIVSQAEG